LIAVFNLREVGTIPVRWMSIVHNVLLYFDRAFGGTFGRKETLAYRVSGCIITSSGAKWGSVVMNNYPARPGVSSWDQLVLLQPEQRLHPGNRVALPRSIRRKLGPDVVVVKWFDGSLRLYHPDHWYRLISVITGGSDVRYEALMVAETMTSSTHACAIDAEGCIALPDDCRRFARIRNRVMVTTATDHVQLWDPEAWDWHNATEGPAESYGFR
jgi:DNA-binding transcriptional regulator/RsmH inhibitor MraZ